MERPVTGGDWKNYLSVTFKANKSYFFFLLPVEQASNNSKLLIDATLDPSH